MLEYRTVAQTTQAEFVEKRSRFIGILEPVSTPEQAAEQIRQVRSHFFDAKHTVFAWRLREEGLNRCSDDGEPQGTAGAPVLSVLEKESLTDCLLTVTRYFGGVLLGTGGLVRAYSHTAALAVQKARIVSMHLCYKGRISCDYRFYGPICALISEWGGSAVETEFAQEVCMTFCLPAKSVSPFQKKLMDLSCGAVQAEFLGEIFCERKK